MSKNELIFNIHKNDIIENSVGYKRNLAKKYNLDEYTARNLFVKIINYQIETYGYQLQKYNDFVSKDEYYRKNSNSKSRKYKRTKG